MMGSVSYLGWSFWSDPISKVQDPVVRIQTIKGAVKHKFKSSGIWRTSQLGSQLAAGDLVLTGPEASATLVDNKGKAFTLSENSVLMIKPIGTDPLRGLLTGKLRSEQLEISQTRNASARIPAAKLESPTQIQLILPDQGSVIESTTPTLSANFFWNTNLSGPFELQIASDIRFENISRRETLQESKNNFTFDRATFSSGLHFWRVIHIGSGLTSKARSFLLTWLGLPMFTNSFQMTSDRRIKLTWEKLGYEKFYVLIQSPLGSKNMESQDDFLTVDLTPFLSEKPFEVLSFTLSASTAQGTLSPLGFPRLLILEKMFTASVMSPEKFQLNSNGLCDKPIEVRFERNFIPIEARLEIHDEWKNITTFTLPPLAKSTKYCPNKAGTHRLMFVAKPKGSAHEIRSLPISMFVSALTPNLEIYTSSQKDQVLIKAQALAPIEVETVAPNKNINKLKSESSTLDLSAERIKDVRIRARYIASTGAPLSPWTKWSETVTSEREVCAAAQLEAGLDWNLKSPLKVYASPGQAKPWTWLSWADQGPEYEYEVQDSPDQDFTSAVNHRSKKPTLLLVMNVKSGKRYWRVRSIKKENREVSAWSRSAAFDIIPVQKVSNERKRK